MKPYRLRAAEERDLPSIAALILELAEFERLAHLVEATPEKLRPHLFGERPAAECVVAETSDAQAEVIAFALYFTNFSTFLARPGLYLEDLYVRQSHRGKGYGTRMLTRLAQIAVERNCGRFEWSVLEWNEPAIGFYKQMGADILPDWRICRLTGDTLLALAERRA